MIQVIVLRSVLTGTELMKTNPIIPKGKTAFETVDLISKLKEIELPKLNSIAQEIDKSVNVNVNVNAWHEPYSEYGSKGLKIAVLMSPDGSENNFSWDDCESPKETELLKSMPVLQKLLTSFNLNIMASRLLKLEPGTFLHEHRDYVYLKRVDRYRLHIPIVTNSSAHIIMPGKKIHMEKGFLWTLDPKNTVHSACNFGTSSRIHIMIDCYMNEELKKLLANASLESRLVENLEATNQEQIEDWLKEAKAILTNSSLKEAEEYLLKKFCQFDLAGKTTFDLLDKFCKMTNNTERQDYWNSRKKEVY